MKSINIAIWRGPSWKYDLNEGSGDGQMDFDGW
jgi:hypothetical protein